MSPHWLCDAGLDIQVELGELDTLGGNSGRVEGAVDGGSFAKEHKAGRTGGGCEAGKGGGGEQSSSGSF